MKDQDIRREIRNEIYSKLSNVVAAVILIAVAGQYGSKVIESRTLSPAGQRQFYEQLHRKERIETRARDQLHINIDTNRDGEYSAGEISDFCAIAGINPANAPTTTYGLDAGLKKMPLSLIEKLNAVYEKRK